jgi:hypothetical protein
LRAARSEKNESFVGSPKQVALSRPRRLKHMLPDNFIVIGEQVGGLAAMLC